MRARCRSHSGCSAHRWQVSPPHSDWMPLRCKHGARTRPAASTARCCLQAPCLPRLSTEAAVHPRRSSLQLLHSATEQVQGSAPDLGCLDVVCGSLRLPDAHDEPAVKVHPCIRAPCQAQPAHAALCCSFGRTSLSRASSANEADKHHAKGGAVAAGLELGRRLQQVLLGLDAHLLRRPSCSSGFAACANSALTRHACATLLMSR